MNQLIKLLLVFTLSNFAFGSVKITNLAFERVSSEIGRMTISLNKNFKGEPKLDFKKNIIQVELPDTVAYPKIEKKITINKSLDSNLMAYQFNKEMVRVRAILPYQTDKIKRKVDLRLGDKKVVIQFPIEKLKALAKQQNKKTKKKSNPEDFDESYFNELIKDKKLSKSFLNDFPDEKKKDVVKEKTAAVAKNVFDQSKENKEGFSIINYLGKFVAFLGAMLLIFYAVVKLFKKKLIKKGKLGILSSNDLVEVVSTTYIGPKKSLMVVKAHNQVMLLSNSDNGISFIKELDEVSELLKASENQSVGTNFDKELDIKNDDSKIEDRVELKEDIYTSSQNKMEKFIKGKSKASNKKSYSTMLKDRVKDLKPMQNRMQ